MQRRDAWFYAWCAGFMVLGSSLVMLCLCTFLDVKNPGTIDVWKWALAYSIGHVVALPLGVAFSKTKKE